MARTVIVRGSPAYEEGNATSAVKPGHVITLGASDGVVPAATAGANIVPRVVIERSYAGEDVNTTIPPLERVNYVTPKKGDRLLLRVATAAPAIAVGDLLQVVVGGTVAKVTTGTPLFESREALTNTSGTDQFLIGEVI